jgi:hypothetical protein
MAHLNPDAHPVERAIVYGVGDGNAVRLAVMDVDKPAFPRWLTQAGEKPCSLRGRGTAPKSIMCWPMRNSSSG